MPIKHQDLTGRSAIHPFAFIQNTDPSLVADNAVTAKKAWIDNTNPASPILKVRDDTNTSWITVIAGVAPPTSLLLGFVGIDVVTDVLPFANLSHNFIALVTVP